ncbi:uncharacterized protein BX664DRAFT_262918 [Halteromyces radiatus]|uniref:uncharacterized protein n=1 Tax=Halteromyces radiatus TaxID=101107 RepID=UPI002220DED5|nr:uncharacterized protein BX664DRAFT_262918 [Halteromyces radiatus]KAI8089293.1 hypothetical protein BX664DRAFT_262918 [Halteromyces radiatus]
MNWSCSCQNKIPDVLPFQWPVTVAECNGKEQTCESGCGSGSTADLCRSQCSQYFKCNRPGSQPSSLRLDYPPSSSSSSSSSSTSSSASSLSSSLTFSIPFVKSIFISYPIVLLFICIVSFF